MNILVTLFPVDKSASDGSVIPTQSVVDYLNSDDYKENLVKRKLAVLGITHKDRKRNNSELRVGQDDTILINKNSIGCITRMFVPGDGYCWAEIEVFNPDFFEGQIREDIMYFTGLLKSGVRPPISAVVDAFWDGNEVAKRINSIDGLDMTLNPGFEGAEVKSILN